MLIFSYFVSGIFQIGGGILILAGIFTIGYYLCGGKKSKKKKMLRRTSRRSQPQELDRAHYGLVISISIPIRNTDTNIALLTTINRCSADLMRIA